MSDLYGAAIGLLIFAGTLIAAYFKGSSVQKDKSELQAVLRENAAITLEIDRNAKHKEIDETVSALSPDDVDAGLHEIFGHDERS